MACTPASINYLPDEILLQILSYVGAEDVYLNIAKVCEKWNALAKDVVLWKKLSYHCDHSTDIKRITQVLTAAPALDALIIRDRYDVADILFHKHIDLRKLILENCLLGLCSTGLLAKIVDFYPDLDGLSLEGCNQFTSARYHVIRRLKKLSELKLSRCKELSGETVRLIVDSCQQLKKLALLSLTLTDDDVIHVIKKLGKQLTTLYLDGDDLTDVAYLYLNNCSRLQELEIFCCKNMTDRGLLEGIGSLQQLTFLRLNEGYNLTAQALSTFLHGPSMTSIELLDLLGCSNLDDEGLKGIAERCTHLRELRVFWYNDVTDVGISMVISHCSQLRILSLMCLNNITGEGWLALVPSHLPHLRELCLSHCRNVCDKYIEQLVAAVPELKVIK